MNEKVDYSCKVCCMLDCLYQNAKEVRIQINLQYKYYAHIQEEHSSVDLV